MTWLLIKSILGKASDWILAHWQLVLFALMALAIWNYKSSYEATTREFDLFKTNIVQLAKDQEAQNAVKLAKAQSQVTIAEADSKAQFDKFNLDRNQSTKDIKALYENIDNVKHNYDERLRMQSSLGTGNTSETSSDTVRPASDTSECNRAIAQYSTLEQACRITTADFNTCRSVIDADTAMYGRQ